MKLFAVSQPGIEEVTLKEIESLGIRGKKVKGGVEFEGGLRELYLTNLWLRTASRILIRLCTFRAKHFGELVRKVKKCNWEDYLTCELPVKFRVTSRKSKLYHTKAIEERVIRGIEEKLGFKVKKAKFEDEGTSVIVRFEKDQCTISINSSGAILHKRGYRVVETEAPLRENLAAAMVLISGWKGENPLIDPFCGSGTIPIEAAMVAANVPPGIKRDFAFKKWKNFDETLWKELLEDAKKNLKKVTAPILGFDVDPKAVEGAKENAKAAGVEEFIEFKQASFPLLPYEKVTVVTNPPFGERLKHRKIEILYAYFGDWLRNNFKEFRAYFITNNPNFAKRVSEKVKEITSFSNGGIRVKLYEYSREVEDESI